MSKVLLATLEFPPDVGGVASYYYRLSAQTNELDLMVWKPEEKFSPWWWRGLHAVRRIIRLEKPKYILVGHILPLGTIVWLLSFFNGIPYAVFVHGMDIMVPQAYGRKRTLIMRILERAHRIITVSRYTEQEIKRLLPESEHDKIRLLPPGPSITPAVLSASDTPLQNVPSPYILSVGRLVERKGFDQTIRALADLPPAYANIHYVIAGAGAYGPKLQLLSEEMGVSNRVHILSGLSDVKIAQLYEHCLFFMMPSRIVNTQDFEGFGIAVLEANSFGKCAVGGNTAGMTDAILDGKTGLLVDPDDVNEIRDAMVRLISQPDKIQRLGEQAKQWVTTEHAWEQKAQQLQKIINEHS